MTTLKFFSHKGFVGAMSDLENGVFINDIKDGNQIGVVVAIEHVAMPSDVKELIRSKHVRDGGSFSTTMLMGGDNPSVGVLGKRCHMLSTKGGVYSISRDCDLSVLDKITEIENVPDPDFVAYIDSLK